MIIICFGSIYLVDYAFFRLLASEQRFLHKNRVVQILVEVGLILGDYAVVQLFLDCRRGLIYAVASCHEERVVKIAEI